MAAPRPRTPPRARRSHRRSALCPPLLLLFCAALAHAAAANADDDAASAAALARCRPGALALQHGLPPAPPLNGDNGDNADSSSFGAPGVRGAASLRACCAACAAVGEPGCGAFAFRPADGLCVLSPSARDPGAGLAEGPAWLGAPLPPLPVPRANASDAASDALGVACTADDVARMSSAALLRAIADRADALSASLAAFWARAGPDAAGGGFHTSLDASGTPLPPVEKSARASAEDLEAFAAHAAAARRRGDAAAARAAQATADALASFLLRAFRPANGTSSAAAVALSESMGGDANASASPLATHLKIISALSIYARNAPDAAASAAALATARAQAAAVEACCYDAVNGGVVPIWEVAAGWFPAGARKTLGTHLAAMHAAAALRNATRAAAARARHNGTADDDDADDSTPLARRLPPLLHIAETRLVVNGTGAMDAPPFAAAYFGADWAPLGGAVGAAAPAAAEYASTLGLLASAVASARALSPTTPPRPPPPPDALRAAAAAAAAAGYDPVQGGFFESGAASRAVKTWWQQTSAAAGLLALWRASAAAGEHDARGALCRAAGALQWLQTRQAAVRSGDAAIVNGTELFWSVDAAGLPVGPHGATVAEPWKGAAALGAMASLAEAAADITAEEADAADARASARAAISAAAPDAADADADDTPRSSSSGGGGGGTGAPAPGAASSAAAVCVAASRAQAVPFDPADELPGGGGNGRGNGRGAPSRRALDVRIAPHDAACCAACGAHAHCASFARRADDGLCVLRGAPAAAAAASSAAAAPSLGWTFGAVSRPPLRARLFASCPAALPSLSLDVPIASLAGQAGPRAPGVPRTPVRLSLSRCAGNASSSMLVPTALGSAQLRGESSRRDYPKKQLSLKFASDGGGGAAGSGLAAALGLPAASGGAFILAAPYDDRSYLRDAMTWHVSAALGLRAPAAAPLELRAASSGDALGLFWAVQRPDDVAAEAAGGRCAHANACAFRINPDFHTLHAASLPHSRNQRRHGAFVRPVGAVGGGGVRAAAGAAAQPRARRARAAALLRRRRCGSAGVARIPFRGAGRNAAQRHNTIFRCHLGRQRHVRLGRFFRAC
jgi:hypothetical protein